MSVYEPDLWVVVKFSGADIPDGVMYKILAGWYGGFAGNDSWKINSGITKITENQDSYSVDGYSGSTYICHKQDERVNIYIQGIYDWLAESYKQFGKQLTMEIVPMSAVKENFVK